MRYIPLVGLLLAACGPTENLITVENSCGYNRRPFPEAWPCVRTGAASLPGAEDLKRYYFATGDMVAEMIRNGKMTEAEGRLAMAETLTKLMSADRANAAANRRPPPVVYQRVGPDTVVSY